MVYCQGFDSVAKDHGFSGGFCKDCRQQSHCRTLLATPNFHSLLLNRTRGIGVQMQICHAILYG